MYMRVIRTHFSIEESAELLRQKLARRPSFSAHEAFSHCDRSKNGYLTSEEFRKLLAENQVFVTDSELESLVARYDHNSDGRISYSEFVQELAPKHPQKSY
jgi:Ca2+-binding EF-hand superfamily protein